LGHTLGHTHPGTAAARVAGNFLVIGPDNFTRYRPKGRLSIAGADWLLWWANAVPALIADEIFYQSIFQGMKADNRQPAAWIK
jgi:hypothetical protein